MCEQPIENGVARVEEENKDGAEEQAKQEADHPAGVSGQAQTSNPGVLGQAQANNPGGLGTAQPLGQPRYHRADRSIILPAMTLDELLEDDHPARDVWKYVEGIDLSWLYDRIRAREHTRGRSAIDPRILTALWLYSILYGVTSARRLSELCQHHHAFRWLAGDIHVNHHTLSDFLVDHIDFLEHLFKHSIEVLANEGLVNLDRIGQDGMRVRASAGAASFHRTSTLERIFQDAKCKLRKVQEQLDNLSQQQDQKEVASDSQGENASGQEASLAKLAAQKRAAEEAIARAEQALERMPEMQAKKKEDEEKAKARVSSTDPEATVMKMANGGFNPAYNFQFATTTDNLIVVGVDVVTEGSDQGQLPPMVDQVEKNCGERPANALVDGGFVNKEDIEEVQSGKEGKPGIKVYAPVPKPKKEGADRYEAKPDDSPEVAEWRQRMGSAEAKEIYKERASSAELVNAHARNRSLIRLLVRTLAKVRAVALWFATVHNMARSFKLIPPSDPVPA